ncbi:MAG: carboxypeptidase-like regulatory domain-containing protein [Phycisphaeraceae bacterium]
MSLFLAIAVMTTPVFGATISGKITDSSGVAPVPVILVEIWKDGQSGAPVYTAYTNATGDYSWNGVTPGDRLRIRVKWQMALGANYDWRVIKLVRNEDTSLTDKTSAWKTFAGNDGINLSMDQLLPGDITNLQTRILEMLDYIRIEKHATTAWSVAYDIPIYLLAKGEGSYQTEGFPIFVPGGIYLSKDNPSPPRNQISYQSLGTHALVGMVNRKHIYYEKIRPAAVCRQVFGTPL